MFERCHRRPTARRQTPNDGTGMTELEVTGALVLVVKPHDSAVITDAIGTHAEQVRLYLGPGNQAHGHCSADLVKANSPSWGILLPLG